MAARSASAKTCAKELVSAADICKFQQTTFDDPVGWSKSLFNIDLWPRQAEIFEAIRDNKEVTVRSGNGIGKTKVAALAVLWWLQTHCPGYAITTSSSWRGVSKVLWPEIRRLHGSATAPLGGEPLQVEYHPSASAPLWAAFGISAKVPENFAGFHNPGGVLVVVDEASLLSDEILEAIQGVTTDELSRILLIGNPLRPSGPFYQTFFRGHWKRLHISTLDSPNVVAGTSVIPGLSTRQWCEDRLADWGEEHPAYQARVLGNFPSSDEDTVIALALVEAAVKSELEPDPNAPIDLGVDVARFGDDLFVIQPVQGMYAHTPVKKASTDVPDVIGLIIKEINKWGKDKVRKVNVDAIGFPGVVDILHEQGYDVVHGINVALPAIESEHYANLRVEGWHLVRDWLEEGGRLPPDDLLVGGLTAPKFKHTSKGQRILEPKEQTKKRLKRSPDEADALMLAILPAPRAPVIQMFFGPKKDKGGG